MIEHLIPLKHPKSLERRTERARKVMHYLQITAPVQIALRIRREVGAWQENLDSNLAMGSAGTELAATATRALLATRAQFLDLIGLPKRPGRPMVDERTVRMIRDAMPEEILVPEPGIEPPPTVPPSTTV